MQLLFLILVTFAWSNLDAQEAYKWKDSSGHTIYGSKPPKNRSDYETFKTRELSSYSENKVLKRMGKSAREAKVVEKEVGNPGEWEAKPTTRSIVKKDGPAKQKFSQVDEVMLKSGEPRLSFDSEGMITSCVVEVSNETDKQVFEISVAFEFPDGSLVPASGPFDLEVGAKADFSIPSELLPLDKVLGSKVGDALEEEGGKEQALPKVIVHSLGGK